MKIFHLSDLHLGKTVYEFSMIEDQEYILKAILNAVDTELPEAIFITGDVFDRSIPSLDALQLFENFLDNLVQRDIKVYIIGGNHDSGERLDFGSSMFNKSGVYITGSYTGNISPYVLSDDNISINIYSLPYIRPIHVKTYNEEVSINSYTEAMQVVIENMNINLEEINILLAHQFVTGATITDSEERNIGGIDNVDAEVFLRFDYVALGHLHKPQYIQKETIRYSGSPLKYSFSEVNHTKTITVVDIYEKNDIAILEIPLIPKHDMRQIRGRYLEITSRDYLSKLNINDYYRIILEDEEDQINALSKLRLIYPNLMTLEYDNKRTRASSNVLGLEVSSRQYTPIEFFDMLYEEQNGQPLSVVQREYMVKIIEEVFEEDIE